MKDWESQIRTNLQDGVDAERLDELLKTAPGLLEAALIDTQHQEGRVRLPEQRDARDETVADAIALTCGLSSPCQVVRSARAADPGRAALVVPPVEGVMLPGAA